MSLFLTIAVILATAAGFVYALSFYDTSKADSNEKKRKLEDDEFQKKTIDPKKIYGKSWERGVVRPRVCPMCGTILSQHEYLFASILPEMMANGKKQAHIYGCKYCFLGATKSGSGSQVKEGIQTSEDKKTFESIKDSETIREIEDL